MKTKTKIQTKKSTAVSVVSIEGHPVPTSSPSNVLGGLLSLKGDIVKTKVKGWEVSEEFVDHSDAHCCECGIHIPQHQNPVKGSDGERHIKDNTFIVAKERAIPSLGRVNDHTDIYCSEECLSVWAKEANAQKYYTLLQFDRHITKWVIVFGDYDRETVEDERDDYEASYGSSVEAEFYSTPIYKIISSSDAQADIEAKVAGLKKPSDELARF